MSRKRKRKQYACVGYRVANKVFDARPEEIRAVRKAMGWKRMDFAAFCGVYCDTMRDDSCTVRRWESGLARPHTIHRAKMLQLVELLGDQYLTTLNAIRSASIRYQNAEAARSNDRNHPHAV